MSITAQRKAEIVGQYRRDDKDSGSPEVQIAVLTERIKALTEHLKQHKHDYSTRRGLLQMVSRRRKLLTYLARVNRAGYQELIQKLELRH